MPTLEITTKLGCSLACRFCPQDRLMKSYPRGDSRELSFGDFRRVVAKVPPHVRLDFSGMAEPWLNERATDMVAQAFDLGRKVAIYTTLQGMQPDDAAMLIGRYAGRIGPETPWVIHLPDDEGNMTGWKRSETYLRTLARFVALRRDHAPAGLTFMTMSARGEVAEPLRAVIGDRLDPFVGISRVENLDRTAFAPGQLLAAARHDGAVLCGSTPYFDHNAMLPNGDVVLCCMDYARRHVLGNLFHQSYEEIHAGAAMGAIRVQAMTPGDDTLICRRCHNAVCLDQEGGTHWRLRQNAMWTALPAPMAMPVMPPAQRSVLADLRAWVQRAGGL